MHEKRHHIPIHIPDSKDTMSGALITDTDNQREVKKHLTTLQEPPFYNKEKEYWVTRVGNFEENTVTFATDTQLLGTWALAVIDPEKSKKLYRRVSDDARVDIANQLWYKDTINDQKLVPHLLATTQLVDLLIQVDQGLRGNSQIALDYEYLREKYVHASTKTWKRMHIFSGITSKFMVPYRDADLTPQLLAALIEQRLHPETASTQLDILEQTPFYNRKTNTWLNMVIAGKIEMGDVAGSYDQLLLILVTAGINIKQAQEQYETLKSSQLYDETTRAWRVSGRVHDLSTDAELLDIVINQTLYKHKKTTPTTVPVIKQFT